MSVLKKSFQYGQHSISIETGEVARQASASVVVSMGDTVVLVTAVAAKKARPGKDFFPLTVNYIEKTYAAGRIPGGFFKREGRPTEKETLTSRLIDRPIRPLFPDGFFNEVQVVAMVVSLDPEIDADVPSLIGASAALSLAGVPFAGPIGASRVGYKNGQYLLNPSRTRAQGIAAAPRGRRHGEVGAHGRVRSLGPLRRSHARRRGVRPRADAGRDQDHQRNGCRGRQAEVGLEAERRQRRTRRRRCRERAEGAVRRLSHHREAGALPPRSRRSRPPRSLALSDGDAAKFTDDNVDDSLFKLESNIVRQRILNGEPRIDGRDAITVRPITVKVGVLPRTHGSALFTRGETQALVATTLGTGRDAQIIDALEGERREPFMFHYNFPPFSVGETGMMGSPKRREIGHGNLARRGIAAMMPDMEKFPYVIRIVSEILESNGSSSMASVCGASPTRTPGSPCAARVPARKTRYSATSHLGSSNFSWMIGERAVENDGPWHTVPDEIMNTSTPLHCLEPGSVSSTSFGSSSTIKMRPSVLMTSSPSCPPDRVP